MNTSSEDGPDDASTPTLEEVWDERSAAKWIVHADRLFGLHGGARGFADELASSELGDDGSRRVRALKLKLSIALSLFEDALKGIDSTPDGHSVQDLEKMADAVVMNLTGWSPQVRATIFWAAAPSFDPTRHTGAVPWQLRPRGEGDLTGVWTQFLDLFPDYEDRVVVRDPEDPAAVARVRDDVHERYVEFLYAVGRERTGRPTRTPTDEESIGKIEAKGQWRALRDLLVAIGVYPETVQEETLERNMREATGRLQGGHVLRPPPAVSGSGVKGKRQK